MSALKQDAKDMLRVLARSKQDADGWAKVSVPVWPLLDCVPPELMDREGDAVSGGRARFTDKGKILMEYLP